MKTSKSSFTVVKPGDVFYFNYDDNPSALQISRDGLTLYFDRDDNKFTGLSFTGEREKEFVDVLGMILGVVFAPGGKDHAYIVKKKCRASRALTQGTLFHFNENSLMFSIVLPGNNYFSCSKSDAKERQLPFVHTKTDYMYFWLLLKSLLGSQVFDNLEAVDDGVQFEVV